MKKRDGKSQKMQLKSKKEVIKILVMKKKMFLKIYFYAKSVIKNLKVKNN